MVGGTSSLNYMLYVRGHWNDYSNWELEGYPGWEYSDIKQWFLKSEQQLDARLSSSGFHGTQGEMGVSFHDLSHPAAKAFHEACLAFWLAKQQRL